MVKHISGLLVAITVTGLASVGVLAHEMTYKGTVIATTNSAVQVKVIDESSQKETPTTFKVTAKTKVFRGDAAVTFAEAHVQKDERIVVTVDHDQDGQAATVIRLAERK